MKRTFMIVLILLSAMPNVFAEGTIHWYDSVREGFAAAKKEGIPVLIDFHASWCAPCRAMEENVWTDEKIIQASENIICVSIDFDTHTALRTRYRVKAIPSMIFTDPYGNEIVRATGYRNAAVMTQVIHALPRNFHAIDPYMEKLESDKNNLEALHAIGQFYRQNNMFDVSNSYFDKLLDQKEIKADPKKHADVLLSMGFNYNRLAEQKKAIKMFDEVLDSPELRMGHEMAYFGKTMTYLAEKDTKHATHTFNEYKQKFPASKGIARLQKYFK